MENINENMNVEKNTNEVIDDGIVRDENGNVRLAELWFDSEKGVVYGTYDIFRFLSPSEKFIAYAQNSLDEFQKGLYYEILMQEEGLDLEKEIEDLKEMLEEENIEDKELCETLEKGRKQGWHRLLYKYDATGMRCAGICENFCELF